MKSTSCRLCSNVEGNERLISKNMRSPLKEKFEYILCKKCNSLSISDIPEDLGKFYENYYSFRPVITKEPLLRMISKKHTLKKTPLLSFFSNKFLASSSDLGYKALAKCNIHYNTKILDVGSGTGQMVYDVYEAGYKGIIGIDPYLDKDIEYQNGCRVLRKSIFEETSKWDVIMLNHVLEHMDNPQAVLKKIKSLLSPSGVALIRIPNIDSYSFKKFKESWYGIQAPVHIFLPSVNAMKEMCNAIGLRIKSIEGENLLEFWMHNIAYELDIWDFDKFGIRTYLTDKHQAKCPAIINKVQLNYLKHLNKEISQIPELCEWINYYIY